MRPSLLLSATLLLPAALTVWLFLDSGGGASAPTNLTGLDPGHIQLIKDALGWMTFRRNGTLMEEAEVESLFFEPVIRKYSTSNFYRKFVNAFEKGVIPRLTLKENQPCDPDQTNKYKDPFNNSVTWHFQKKFTLESYPRRNSNKAMFCDYRQGLQCHPTKRLCLCPEGSTMEPIQPNPDIKRCLLQENQVCSLIDIDHGSDPKHSALATNLYHMIFNLEKPLSCTEGTQCRFKENKNVPFCYSKGPWDTGRFLDLGDECAIGLYASPGTCATQVEKKWVRPGYTCYNFGPPRSFPLGTDNEYGFCALEEGSFGLVASQLIASTSSDARQAMENVYQFRPLFIAFVHPRTVPLRGEELRQFYSKYFDLIGSIPQFDDVLQEDAGGKCSVKKTEAMEAIWKYFASLEDSPPPGEDFVPGATKPELHSNLEAAINLTVDWEKKVCRVYQERRGSFRESLKCVPSGTTDVDGNDGTCQEPGNLETSKFSKKVTDLLHLVTKAHTDQNLEELDDDTLKDHLDASKERWLQMTVDNEKLEPKVNSEEEAILQRRINKEFQRLQNLSSLGSGDHCSHQLENRMRLLDESSLATFIELYIKDGQTKLVCGTDLKCTKHDFCDHVIYDRGLRILAYHIVGIPVLVFVIRLIFKS